MLLSYFDRIYVINLPERLDRRKRITQELERVDSPIHPGRAEIFPAIRPSDAWPFPSIGARGCYLSHLSVLSRALEDNVDSVVVMEDDLTLHPQFRERAQLVLNELRHRKWGIVYLGHFQANRTRDVLEVIEPSCSVGCLHFYAVHACVLLPLTSFLREVLERAPGSPEGGPMHVDGAICRFSSTPSRVHHATGQSESGYAGDITK